MREFTNTKSLKKYLGKVYPLGMSIAINDVPSIYYLVTRLHLTLEPHFEIGFTLEDNEDILKQFLQDNPCGYANKFSDLDYSIVEGKPSYRVVKLFNYEPSIKNSYYLIEMIDGGLTLRILVSDKNSVIPLDNFKFKSSKTVYIRDLIRCLVCGLFGRVNKVAVQDPAFLINYFVKVDKQSQLYSDNKLSYGTDNINFILPEPTNIDFVSVKSNIGKKVVTEKDSIDYNFTPDYSIIIKPKKNTFAYMFGVSNVFV